ncbi:MAG: 2-phosphosulfolactate phosphatase [Actinomycetia bacterium]|nr:2-phosphosulfolactate phosphatase [Actinomycetes bacterium]
MRAFTVAAWALHLGADHLVLVDDLESAITLADPNTLLFKDGIPDDRFDLHNSPHQLQNLDVTGRRIIQRTTAGTRAALAAREADNILCASFVCATATAHQLMASPDPEVTFVISGGLHAEEDLACAEFIAATAQGRGLSSEPYLRRADQSAAAADLRAGVAKGYTGVTHHDVPMCLDPDRFDFAMAAHPAGEHLHLRPTNQ